MYAHEVCLTGSYQIITCNDWDERLALLSPVQQEWLTGNVIVAYVPTSLVTDVNLYDWNSMWSQTQ